jgi:ubiquitin-conjugating enzyme E2 J2
MEWCRACSHRQDNLLEWHFVIKGPKDTPYSGGAYHGKLIFPSEYPYKPPAIMMLTPK